MDPVSYKEIPTEKLSELLCEGFDLSYQHGTTLLSSPLTGVVIDLEHENVKAIRIKDEEIHFFYNK